ncbi:TIGR02444 family protein [Stutzerimonas nitrititolerans]|uniref:TIGR02444 family protein n=1 Tax=Stutzerimonas nitrititolerans TaxID=2482751 RepID=UPI0028A8B6B4|nr:TIGR02444 family protein [Stutzerimonas nitrititolerans]
MRTTDLWSFSLACYARPGVERLCLELQEQGVDICLLLCGAWLEARAITCTPQRLERLRQLADHWQHEVVTPLRSLRQNWRGAAQSDPQLNALREQLKALELAAEKTLLGRLERETHDWSTQSGPAAWLEPLTGAVRDGDAAREFLRRIAAAVQLELAGA